MQEKNFIRSLAAFVRARGIYIAALVCALAVGVSGVAYFTRAKVPEDPPAQAQTPEAKPIVPDGKTVDAAKLLPETVKPEAKPEPAPEPAVFTVIMPVEGDLIQLYSMDHLSYNPTTRDWRTHDGVDIQAAPGSEVRCAADGTVDSVQSDAAMGTVVTVRHEGGFLSRYGNLGENPGVAEGQKLRRGDVLGVIGSDGLMETGLESHLHFELCRNGESVNPTDYFEW